MMLLLFARGAAPPATTSPALRASVTMQATASATVAAQPPMATISTSKTSAQVTIQ